MHTDETQMKNLHPQMTLIFADKNYLEKSTFIREI